VRQYIYYVNSLFREDFRESVVTPSSDSDQHVQRKKREKKKRICGHTCLSDSDKHVNTFAEGFLLCVRVGQ